MNTLSFCLGNIAAWFGKTSATRARYRGMVNMFFYRGKIRRFLRDELGVRLETLEYVRQRTLNRVVFLANGKYYIKRLCDFAFLMEYIRPHISVVVPPVVASSRYQMYSCEKIAGRPMVSFDRALVRKNAKKIRAQVMQIIDELQSIDVSKIPDNKRFEIPMQSHHAIAASNPPVRVLEHWDLNDTNIFLDDDLNVCAVIDWDTISISKNSEFDRNMFTHWFNEFIKK